MSKTIKVTKTERKDTFDLILRYEMGELLDNEVVELFQHLIDTGLAWQLQGHYGRTAMHLIENGDCTN